MRDQVSRARRGANAVEFALIAPVLVLILFGAMEYSWMFLNQICLDSAVAQGGLHASMVDPANEDPGLAGVTVAQDQWTATGLQGSPVFSSYTLNSAGNELVTIDGELPYKSLLGGFVPAPQTLKAVLTARLEVQP